MTDAPKDQPTDALADRYGRRSDGRRFPLALVMAVILGVPFLVWLAWVVWIQANPAVQSTERSFTVVDEHLAVANVQVTLADDAVDPTCRIRALAADKQPVGELQFTPVDGDNEVEIRTERKATAVELIGCVAEGQTSPR